MAVKPFYEKWLMQGYVYVFYNQNFLMWQLWMYKHPNLHTKFCLKCILSFRLGPEIQTF